MCVLVRKFADTGLVRAQDQLGDRLDGLRAPRLGIDEGITVFDAGGRHDAGEVALAGGDVVGDAGLIIDIKRGEIAA